MAYIIKSRAGLSLLELQQIQALARACEQYEGLTMKLNWSLLHTRPPNLVNDFLCYQHSKLVGYLALYTFDGTPQAEASVMVHPAHRQWGLCRRLLKAAGEVLIARQIFDILFICEEKSGAGQACLKTIGASYENSEYKMTLGQPVSPTRVPGLELRLARVDEHPLLAQLDQVCFDITPQAALEMLENTALAEQRRTFVAKLEGQLAGKIQVMLGREEIYIFGFCLLPELRGRGLGRAMLTQTLQQLTLERRQPISLEVAVKNSPAFDLYRRCGFQVVTTYDYYRYPINLV